MMEKRIGPRISMIRGDSYAFYVSLEVQVSSDPDVFEPRPFEDGDTVRFTVKKNTHTKEIVFDKTITKFTDEGWAYIQAQPENTQEHAYGTYRYDVEVTFKDGWVETLFRQPSLFVLEEEVTH